LNTATAGRLFFVYDSISSKKLLVDTRSTYSIFPLRSTTRPYGPKLKEANGQRICCWGSRRRELHIAGRPYQWQFLQADVSFPIFGVDFLREFKLLVNIAGKQLIPCSSAAISISVGDNVFAVSLLLPALAAGGPGLLSGEAGGHTHA
jgi:hypothetical protein